MFPAHRPPIIVCMARRNWFPLGPISSFRYTTHPMARQPRDQTRVGFTLAKDKPSRRFITIVPTAVRDEAHFHIPAGDPNWEAHAEVVFQQDAELVWFLPHMHLRGKDMTYRLIYPSGVSETVLRVKYDFGWQLGYDVQKPILVPKGTRLEATAHFDNSANNRFNPDPSKDVWWGDQTWEEMMIPYFGVIVRNNVNPGKIVAYSTGVRRGEIGAIGMMEHQRADARLRIHHHSFGQAHADFVGVEQLPDPC